MTLQESSETLQTKYALLHEIGSLYTDKILTRTEFLNEKRKILSLIHIPIGGIGLVTNIENKEE